LFSFTLLLVIAGIVLEQSHEMLSRQADVNWLADEIFPVRQFLGRDLAGVDSRHFAMKRTFSSPKQYDRTTKRMMNAASGLR
jgi:hypothetical protein